MSHKRLWSLFECLKREPEVLKEYDAVIKEQLTKDIDRCQITVLDRSWRIVRAEIDQKTFHLPQIRRQTLSSSTYPSSARFSIRLRELHLLKQQESITWVLSLCGHVRRAKGIGYVFTHVVFNKSGAPRRCTGFNNRRFHQKFSEIYR